MLERNVSTLSRRLSELVFNCMLASFTCPAAIPVSAAALLTASMFSETRAVLESATVLEHLGEFTIIPGT